MRTQPAILCRVSTSGTAVAEQPASNSSAALPATRIAPVCRHCGGSGREPAALVIEFSRSGDLRGGQQRMAEETGISAAMLSYIITGQRAPSIYTLIKIARHCRTTVDRVLRIPAIWKRVHDEQK